MSHRGTIHRHSLIIEFLKYNKNWKKKRIVAELENEGYKFADRTFDRDIDTLRNEYGLSITSKAPDYFYILDLEKSKDYEYILKYIELAVTAGIIGSTIKESKEAREYISFDAEKKFQGSRHLVSLLKAIKETKNVQFAHTSFQSGHVHRPTVSPLLLKEYQGRWYLVGENVDLGVIRTYGLDRINDLHLTTLRFTPKKPFKADEYFCNSIGISNYALDNQKIQEIELSFTQQQIQYFRTYPWYPEYTETKVADEDYRVKMILLPNYELLQRLLMHSDSITVIKPQWLIDKITVVQHESLRKYGKIK